jgi:SAM-dependent methyltransferase
MSPRSADPVAATGETPGPRFEREFRDHLRAPKRTNPFRHVVIALRESIARLIEGLELQPGERLLDYGCAEMQYRELIGDGVEVVGADLPGNPVASIEIRADGTLPVEDASFDAVISTQVLEHVADPALYLSECERVLRPGGRLLLSTHGIMVYHPDPVDLWRWTWAGLERIVADAGLEVVRRDDVMGLATTGAQLFQDGIFHRLGGPRRKRAFAAVMQVAIGALARFEPGGGPRHNALVFALIARKPEPGSAQSSSGRGRRSRRRLRP